MQIKPLISIVTVAYNAESTIECTILSVINQSYTNIEYIIIDGGSKDKTVEIIKKYSDRISCWISEPDKGIYDAMNKGIKLATGEWINFMNCGDSFVDETTIENTFNQATINADIIYGNTILLFTLGNFLQKPGIISSENYMPFGHQASFTKTTLMKKYGFNTKFKICADRCFFHTVVCNDNVTFEYVDINIANYEAEEGLSSVNYITQRYEIGLIDGKSDNILWILKFYIDIFILKFKQAIKIILPKKLTQRIKASNLRKKFGVL